MRIITPSPTASEGRMRPAAYERAKAGWGGFFDRIAERLSG